ncbi:MAG: hypothetical protein JWR42_1766 [Marmoricola sp.]|nr:hypothetical protein [Marmoricola sp.]
MRDLFQRALRRTGLRRPAAPTPAPTTPLEVAAVDAGWTLDEPSRRFLGALGAICDDRPGVRVGVLVGAQDRGTSAVVTAGVPGSVVSSVRAGVPAADLHVELAAAGPFDVLVDDLRAGARRAPLLRRTFWHLVDGGSYLVRARHAGVDDLSPDQESVSALVQRLEALADDPEAPKSTRREQDDLALAQGFGRVELARRHLVVRKTGESYAKLREPQASKVLELRGGRSGRVLEVVPGLHLTPRCELRESESFRAGGMPPGFDVPDLSLRSYEHAVCAPGQVAILDHLLLPDTFRHVQRKRLANRFLQELAPAFGRPTEDVADPVALPGSYYYLDSEFRGHFGHALTEQVSRFWGWAEAKRADPSLKALVGTNAGRDRLARFELDLFAAAGISEADIELIDRPVRVDRLVAATPMLGNPAYVHPEILATWRDVGRSLAAGAPDRDYPRRVFCSRREQTGPGAFTGSRRECRNGAELETLFADHGFEVIYTEDFDLAEQARIFREAEVVAGYAGSALFNLVFTEEPTHVIVVSSESYTAKNEYVIASVAGHRIDIAWCEAEIPMPGKWNSKAFNSPFSFDFDREGVFLREVLAGL